MMVPEHVDFVVKALTGQKVSSQRDVLGCFLMNTVPGGLPRHPEVMRGVRDFAGASVSIIVEFGHRLAFLSTHTHTHTE